MSAEGTKSMPGTFGHAHGASLSAQMERAASVPDFMRGFGVDIPEEEEPVEEGFSFGAAAREADEEDGPDDETPANYSTHIQRPAPVASRA